MKNYVHEKCPRKWCKISARVCGVIRKTRIGNAVLIQNIQNKLNSAEYLPPKAYRRNFRYYELVSYVNNITGCYLSGNLKTISVLIDRIKYFTEQNPSTEDTSKYYELVSEYIIAMEAELNEQRL